MPTLQKNINYDYKGCFLTAIWDMFESESLRLNRERKPMLRDGETRESAYECIHLVPNRFLESVGQIVDEFGNFHREGGVDKNRKTFLDVGCGVGQKVYLARNHMGLDAYGLELRPAHAARARELIKQFCNGHQSFSSEPSKGMEAFDGRVMTGDAITFQHYKDFDYIYFYCPANEHNIEVQIELAIIKNAKVGAIVTGFLTHLFIGQSPASYGWKLIKNSGCRDSFWQRVSEDNILTAKGFFQSLRRDYVRTGTDTVQLQNTFGIYANEEPISLAKASERIHIRFNPDWAAQIDVEMPKINKKKPVKK